MFTPYRLAYLGIAIASMAGFTLVSAGMGSDDRVSGRLASLKSLAQPEEGYEKGNLSEAGAVELMSVHDFEFAGAASRSKPVLIFKHSTECPISGAAYRRMSEWMQSKGEDAPRVFLVKVIERRPVSQEIAARTAVKHESPQIILIDRARPVWFASHEEITGDAIDAALADLDTKHKKTD